MLVIAKKLYQTHIVLIVEDAALKIARYKIILKQKYHISSVQIDADMNLRERHCGRTNSVEPLVE